MTQSDILNQRDERWPETLLSDCIVDVGRWLAEEEDRVFLRLPSVQPQERLEKAVSEYVATVTCAARDAESIAHLVASGSHAGLIERASQTERKQVRREQLEAMGYNDPACWRFPVPYSEWSAIFCIQLNYPVPWRRLAVLMAMILGALWTSV